MTKNIATQAFAKNRAEELDFDLWDEFVVPLYFDKLSLDEVRKPLLFEGGRGCGKTSLLRYLSHGTQLSPKRLLDPRNLPRQIGLYLRADTQYLRTLRGETLEQEGWYKAFEHELCLSICLELCSAIGLLGAGAQRRASFPGIDELDLSIFRDFDEEAPTDLVGLTKHLRSRKNKFSMWLNNREDYPRPAFLPLRHVLLQLIGALHEQLAYLSGVVFFVFIDEYENLLEYQMKVINTLLKHSEAPLIFHIAAKRNGMATRMTTGPEQLQERDDFRKFDVEEESAEDFPLFAAELFCFRLRKRGVEVGPDNIGEELLCSAENLQYRRKDVAYRRATLEAARSVLPGLSWDEAAAYALDDASLRSRLEKQLGKLLAQVGSSLPATKFLRPEAATSSICIPALLHQGKHPDLLLNELEKAVQGEPSKFTDGEWIHHYFAGSLYFLSLPLQRPCVLYAGFDSFLKLSRGNARHFLELCHLSIIDARPRTNTFGPVSIEVQASAARSASALFVKETQGSGDQGNRLFQVVNTLGQIFRLSQARPSQSEAERTHFSVPEGALTGASEDILRECVKWSVLFEMPETKVKTDRLEAFEYIFNPIYAPYFGISFNKGRKLELQPSIAEHLFNGNRAQLDEIVKEFKRVWKLGESDQADFFKDWSE